MSDPKPEKRIRNPDAMRRYHLLMAGEPCERCQVRMGTQVHHSVYRGRGGDDLESNFEWLCPTCHRAEHGGF